jgi:SAM-dependent methyltransferase
MSSPTSSRSGRTLDYLLDHTLFQSRCVDPHGDPYHPRGRAKLSVALNRALIERGARAPWMWSAERCRQFWAALESGEDPNAPNGYAAKRTEVVDFLHDFWSPEIASTDTVVEVGCNAGANLERLRLLGYRRLSGVEINPNAIAELRRTFPELAQTVDIHPGPLEDVLVSFDTNAFEALFAMAVLHHIHPASRSVFAEMVRVARHHVCVLEPEHVVSHYVYCRDYKRVFESLGCRQLRAVEIGRSNFPEVSEAYYGYTARLFRVPGS